MVEHFLPGGVKLTAVLLQEPLLGQGDGLLGRSQDLHRPLKLLSGFLGFNLSLQFQKQEEKSFKGGENDYLKKLAGHKWVLKTHGATHVYSTSLF